MEKINWKQKLTSRKFWVAVVGFVTSILTTIGYNDNTIVMATGIIMAGASLIAYIIGEGLVDASREQKNEGDVVGGKEEKVG